MSGPSARERRRESGTWAQASGMGQPGVEENGRREWAAMRARKGEEKRMSPWMFFPFMNSLFYFP